MRQHLIAIAAIVLAIATSACATAADKKPGTSINFVVGSTGAQTQQEADDAQLYAEASQAIGERGYPGLAPFLKPMRQAMARAPASYPAVVTLGNGDTLVRGNDEADGMMLSIMAGGASAADGKDAHLIQGINVYPMIAMLLGSEAVERGAFSEAHVYLDQGLALQPTNWVLLSEKAAAYLGQNSWKKAIELADTALASDDILIAVHKDSFLRKRGFALVELGRLLEARAAYEAALKANEDDAVSRNEIKYIDGLLAGKAPTDSFMTSPASRPDQKPQ